MEGGRESVFVDDCERERERERERESQLMVRKMKRYCKGKQKDKQRRKLREAEVEERGKSGNNPKELAPNGWKTSGKERTSKSQILTRLIFEMISLLISCSIAQACNKLKYCTIGSNRVSSD